MKLSRTVLLLLLVIGIALGVAVGRVGSHAVDVWAEQVQQPPSATETILQSRQTPPVPPDNRSSAAWMGAGLLALALVLMGSILFTMRGGAELLRQWRLARKRPSRRQHRIPYPSETTWAEIPQVRQVQYLPEVNDEQMVDSWD